MGVLTSSFKPRPRRLLSLAHHCLASRFSPPGPSSISRFLHSPPPSVRPSFPSHSLLRSHSFSPLRFVSTHYNGDAPGADDNNNSADQFVSCSVAASADSASEESNDQPPTSSPSHRRQLDKDVDSAYQSRRTRFKLAFQKRVLDWQDVPGSLDSFPYYLSESTRDALVDCTAAHLWQPKFASYGLGLPVSSRRICLRGPAGSEVYQEKLVEALAKHLKASLLVLDSTILSPHDYGDQEFSSESEGEYSDSEVEHVEGWSANDGSSQDAPEDQDGDSESSRKGEFKVDALLEFAADSVEEYKQKLLLQERKERRDAGHEDDDQDFGFRLRKGDRVKYVGSSDRFGKIEQAKQVLKVGQKGRIVSVPKGHTGKVGVQFESYDRRSEEPLKTNKKLEEIHRTAPLVDWCDLSDLEPDESLHSEEIDDWLASAEALCEMAPSTRPLVVFFPDPKQWFERAVPSSQRKEFLERVEAKLDQIEGPIVLIASRTNEEEVDYDDKKRLEAHLEGIRSRLNMKTPAGKWTVEEAISPEDVYELFVNTIKIYAPQDEQQLREWKKRLQHDKELCNAKRNLQQLQKVLELHNMDCAELSSVDSFGLNLTDSKAEKVVGWARNHHLGLCLFEPLLVDGKLMIPHTSMERAMARMREQENRKAINLVDYKAVAEDEYEKALLSAVIRPDEVGVSFDDIGALENVKDALSELVMLPLQRPELFTKGNLAKPCKGVLLFGPPGTGKTLLAKAVATEAGANFINITGSTITSKWFGDAEKLTKALFSLAKKLAPTIIFVDEVDSLLGARGGSSEHEATRKTRNEFMAAWDGLKSKDSERVLVLAATNRPYDLDDAVVRRLPRRILVDLPDFVNRVKILRVILSQEELAEGFNFDELARLTHGYSGSDLKNLSVSAAYRPIREYLEDSRQQQMLLGTNEGGSKASSTGVSPTLRALLLDDFQEAMKQVGASVAFDATSMNELRQWNDKYGEGGSRKKSTFGFF
jgi:SpoVK/Ycf46/Vps4 family AAA+-type ATPase